MVMSAFLYHIWFMLRDFFAALDTSDEKVVGHPLDNRFSFGASSGEKREFVRQNMLKRNGIIKEITHDGILLARSS